jgi:predicted dehydrogenase
MRRRRVAKLCGEWPAAAMAEAEVLRTAVIGMGKLGLLHAATFNVLPGCRLVAVADKNKTMLQALKANTDGVETYTEHDRLLKEVKPDLVAIATPTGTHVPIALDCIALGIPVFIEKPLSLNGAQAKPLLEALQRKPVVNMVGYMTRFLPTFLKGKEIIASGALGKLQMLRSSMYIGQLFRIGKGWRYDRAQSGGGVLMTQNSHLLDLLLWYFGPVEWISAQNTFLYSREVEDSAHVFMHFRNGLRGFFDSSWSARHYRTPTMSIHVQGERGTLDVGDDDVRLFLDDASGPYDKGFSTWRKPDLLHGAVFDIGGANYSDQAMQFLGAIRKTDKVESDVSSAYAVQCVIDAAYSSAEQRGAPIQVKATL